MSILSLSQTRSGDTATVVAVSDLASPTFFWYFDGTYVGSTQVGTRSFNMSPGEQARIAVVDADLATTDFDPIADGPDRYPSRVTLEWIRVFDSDVARYLIHQSKNAGAYTEIGRVTHVPGLWSYRFTTDRLEDLATYQWKITTVDRVGNQSAGLVLSGLKTIVRWPDAPNCVGSFLTGPFRLHVEAA